MLFPLQTLASEALSIAISATIDIPPYIWIDRCTQLPTGTGLHTLSRIAKDLETNIEVIPMETTEHFHWAYQQFDDGKIDFFAAISESRMENHKTLKESLINYEGNIAYNTNKPLSSQVLLNMTGKTISLIGQREYNKDLVGYLKKNGHKVRFVKTRQEGFDLLVKQEVDGLLIDRNVAHLYLAANTNIKNISSFRFSPLNRHAYINYKPDKVDPEIIKKIESKLRNYKASGIIEKVSKSYLNAWILGDGCVDSDLIHNYFRFKKLEP